MPMPKLYKKRLSPRNEGILTVKLVFNLTKEKDFQVMVCMRIQTRSWIKAKTPEEAKKQVEDEFLKHGLPIDMFFLARQIKWLHGKYPKDIGFEAVSDWK